MEGGCESYSVSDTFKDTIIYLEIQKVSVLFMHEMSVLLELKHWVPTGLTFKLALTLSQSLFKTKLKF